MEYFLNDKHKTKNSGKIWGRLKCLKMHKGLQNTFMVYPYYQYMVFVASFLQSLCHFDLILKNRFTIWRWPGILDQPCKDFKVWKWGGQKASSNFIVIGSLKTLYPICWVRILSLSTSLKAVVIISLNAHTTFYHLGYTEKFTSLFYSWLCFWLMGPQKIQWILSFISQPIRYLNE